MSAPRPVARPGAATGAGPVASLPGAPHLPGRTPRPPEAAFAPFKAALEAGLEPGNLAGCAAFRAGQELFSDRYYWEAHELFEAVWIRLPPASAERVLLRGLIQLANAGLKRRMGRAAAAGRVLALADAALEEAARRMPGGQQGLPPTRIAGFRRQAAGETVEE